jgi:hydroxylamine reductase
MFCYQCEQTAKGTGCTVSGVCGKLPQVAGLQDVIMYQMKGIGYLAHELRQHGYTDDETNKFTVQALFSTITNVNFDEARLMALINQGYDLVQKLLSEFKKKGLNDKQLPTASTFRPAQEKEELLKQAEAIGIQTYHTNLDLRSLQHILL